MISIVTGTLNRASLLPNLIKNTIDSDDRLELVLLDGGSTDGTQDYIKSLNHPRINFIEIGKRTSYAHFMNLGIQKSKYEIVAQWNDDVLLENSWDEVFDILNDNIYIYKFYWMNVSLNNKIMIYPECLNFGLYRKVVYRECGLYSTAFKYYSADSEMYCRAVTYGFKGRTYPNIIVKELNVPKVTDSAISNKHDLFLKMRNEYKQTHKLPIGVELLKDK